LNKKVQVLFERLESERVKLLDQLAVLPNAKLDYRPDLKKWSVNHILIHLLTSEHLTLVYLRKKSLGIDQLKNAGLLELVKIQLLKTSQRLPFAKYKVPKHIALNTPDVMPFGELQTRWGASRAELKNFLETIEEKNLHKLIFKHPVAGRFDILQCLIFMREHFQHHLPQIKRLL
jgi:hypothetical protein